VDSRGSKGNGREANYKTISQQLGVYEGNNLLRCKGGIEHADTEYDAKHSIVLPGKHCFIELTFMNCPQCVHRNGLAATFS